jgi:hypothetical protein
MIGATSGTERGIIPRAVETLLKCVEQTNASTATTGWHYELQASFLEIYNEEVSFETHCTYVY